MSYYDSPSERIRIQLEIFCENLTDCISSISNKNKRNIVILLGLAVLFTMRRNSKGIKTIKPGIMGKPPNMMNKPKKPSLLQRLTGKAPKVAPVQQNQVPPKPIQPVPGQVQQPGGLRPPPGQQQIQPIPGQIMPGQPGQPGQQLQQPGGLRPPQQPTGVQGIPNGKTTAMLADSNPQQIMTLDTSIHFYDYGGAQSFAGQIETVQAYDAPNFVSQILNTPGQNKVLVIDGGGLRPDVTAVFDADMGQAAVRNGWKGIIVNGVVRKTSQLSSYQQLGIKALGTSPKKGTNTMGQKGMQVSIGSTQLQPGWWIYADADGVIISQTDISGGMPGAPGQQMPMGQQQMPMGQQQLGAPPQMNQPPGIQPMNNQFGQQSQFGQQNRGTMGQMNPPGMPQMNPPPQQMGMQQPNTMGGIQPMNPPQQMGQQQPPPALNAPKLGQPAQQQQPPRLGVLQGGYGGAMGLAQKMPGGALGSYSSRKSFSSSPYANNFAKQRKKRKMFKMLLASSIAAICWLVFLR